MRILIVDDHEFLRRAVRELLSSRADFEVCGEAQDGSEAIRKAVELLPDLILLDISMPGPDGLEAARTLRQLVPAVKILVMSQNDPEFLLPQTLAAGAQGCVDKSRLAAELLPVIDRLMGKSEDPGAARLDDGRQNDGPRNDDRRVAS
jgi:two-component system, NarL family, response regulator NreC